MEEIIYDKPIVEITIEEFEGFDDDDDMYVQKTYLSINGEQVNVDTDLITAILEHLGFDVVVNYI